MIKKKVILFSGFIILFVFICSYIVSQSGYYEYSLNGKKSLTEEQIKKFEEDVKNGENVDINEYFSDSYIDYTNGLTKASVRVSRKVNDCLKFGIEGFFSILNRFVS